MNKAFVFTNSDIDPTMQQPGIFFNFIHLEMRITAAIPTWFFDP